MEPIPNKDEKEPSPNFEPITMVNKTDAPMIIKNKNNPRKHRMARSRVVLRFLPILHAYYSILPLFGTLL